MYFPLLSLSIMTLNFSIFKEKACGDSLKIFTVGGVVFTAGY